MIEPVSFRILVKPDDIIEKQYKTDIKGFVIAGDDKERAQKGVDSGTVVSCGPTAFADYKLENPLAPGDTIVFAKFAGKPVEDPDCPDVKFVIINDEDVVAIIRKSADSAIGE